MRTPRLRAEGERDASGDEPSESMQRRQAEPPRTTPSQAEGDDDSGEGDFDS